MTDAGDYNVAAQLERTVLAWNRSSLAIGANGALLAREGLTRGLAAVAVAGCVVAVVGAVVWVLSVGLYPAALERQAVNLLAGRAPVVIATALFVVALSAADLVLAATS
jgi:uncharacterized membrane protein YidH (DUF202 family)